MSFNSLGHARDNLLYTENNLVLFHFWPGETMPKDEKVSKYFVQGYRS